MKKTRADLLNGPIYKQVLIFFFPVLLGTFFQQLYNTVDASVVGKFVGKEALGAVGGSTGTLINLLVGFLTGLSSGATVAISQLYGSRDFNKIRKTVANGMFLSFALGLILMIPGIVFAEKMLVMMNVPESILPYSVIYLRIYLAGLIPSLIYNMGAGILRAAGDSKRPLYFLIAGTIVNIIFDILFVVVFKWGITGAAVATVISQVVSCILVLLSLNSPHEPFYYRLRDTSYDKDLLNSIVKIGLPTGIQSVLYTGSNILIQSSVNGFGTDTVAAYTAANKLDALYWMISGAFSVAVLTVAGQNYGAGNLKRVKQTFWQTTLIDLILTAVFSVVMYYVGPYGVRLFTEDPEVISIASNILRFLCRYWFTFILVEILSSGLRACGDSLYPMLITVFGIAVFRVIWLVFFPSDNIFGTLSCFPASWILTSVLILLYYFSNHWQKVKS